MRLTEGTLDDVRGDTIFNALEHTREITTIRDLGFGATRVYENLPDDGPNAMIQIAREEMRFYAPAPVSLTQHEHALEVYTDQLMGRVLRAPTVYEQANGISEVGAGIGLRPSTMDLFRRWGIFDAM